MYSSSGLSISPSVQGMSQPESASSRRKGVASHPGPLRRAAPYWPTESEVDGRGRHDIVPGLPAVPKDGGRLVSVATCRIEPYSKGGKCVL